MAKWRIEDNKILRGTAEIAVISREDDGHMRWDGMGMFRSGFKQIEDVLEDVKYFHRYPNLRHMRITLKSGRIVVL
jgi:hypothetical protein